MTPAKRRAVSARMKEVLGRAKGFEEEEEGVRIVVTARPFCWRRPLERASFHRDFRIETFTDVKLLFREPD